MCYYYEKFTSFDETLMNFTENMMKVIIRKLKMIKRKQMAAWFVVEQVTVFLEQLPLANDD